MLHVLQWLLDHGQAVSAMTGLGTLAVWVVYLQVFVNSYRRQLRATLLITRGAGSDLDANCFLSNMSSGPLYVQSVLVTLETRAGSTTGAATDLRWDDCQRLKPTERTRQGPLGQGEMRSIGSFKELMLQTLSGEEERLDSVEAVTIDVIIIYGSENLPAGARRRFIIDRNDDGPSVHGETLVTTQIRKRRQRKRLIKDALRDR